MLAKILSGAGGFGSAPLFISSSINRVTTAGNTVTAPTSIQNGDLLVAVGFNLTNGLTITPPNGFNVIALDGAADNTIFLATKVASSESGNYTWTWSSAAGNSVAMLVYRNATRVNTVSAANRITSTTCTAPSITPTYAGVLCAMFASEGASPTVTTPPSGLTQRALSSSSGAMGVYDLSSQAASATSSYALIWNGSNPNVGLQFQVTNEPDVTPTFVASANTQNGAAGSSLVINKPTGTVEGDLMIASMDANTALTWTGDTGWTELADQGANPSLRIAYKVAGASEPSSYTFTASVATQALTGCILTYRYAAYDTIAGSFTTGADPLVLSSISPTLSQSILLAIGARGASSVTIGTPTSMTARVTDNDGTGSSYKVCDQQVPKGPTGTRSMSTGGTANVAGIMLALKPTRSL